MTTTIAVKEETFNILKLMKQETNSETYDETIIKLVAEAKKTKKSYFGKFKGLGEFKREEIDRFA